MLDSVQTSESKTVVLEPSATARVYSIKLNVSCVVCGATWGVRVLNDYTLPLAWDECLVCKRNKNKNVNQDFSKVEKSENERTK